MTWQSLTLLIKKYLIIRCKSCKCYRSARHHIPGVSALWVDARMPEYIFSFIIILLESLDLQSLLKQKNHNTQNNLYKNIVRSVFITFKSNNAPISLLPTYFFLSKTLF